MNEKEGKARDLILEAMKLLVEERRMTFVNELQSVANRIYPQGRGTVYAIANPARARQALSKSGKVVTIGKTDYKEGEWIHPSLRTDEKPAIAEKKTAAEVTDTLDNDGDGESEDSKSVEFSEDMTNEQILEAFGGEEKLKQHLIDQGIKVHHSAKEKKLIELFREYYFAGEE